MKILFQCYRNKLFTVFFSFPFPTQIILSISSIWDPYQTLETRLLYKMKSKLSIWKEFLRNVVAVCAVSHWQWQGSGRRAEK